MDAMEVIENNYNAKADSFLYYLQDKSIFNKDAFRLLLESIRKVADEGVDISRTAQKINVIYSKILKCLLYNFDANDDYKIINLPENYNKLIALLDKNVEYYFSTRI